MSNYYKINVYGYKIISSPSDFLRRILHLSTTYLPYADGQNIGINLLIKPNKKIKRPENIKCEWCITDNCDGNLVGSGNFDIPKWQQSNIKHFINSDFLTQTQELKKYTLTLKLSKPNNQVYYPITLALLSVLERGTTVLKGIPVILSIIAIIISIISIVVVSFSN